MKTASQGDIQIKPKRSLRFCMALGLSGLLYCQHTWSATPAPVTFESMTREADYTLGSIARQHITVHLPPGFELDASSLPAPAGNEAIELREAQWEVEDLPQERLFKLRVDWQIFVAGDTTKIMPLKKLHLEFQRGEQRLTVDVPADKVIVSSLLPARIDAEHVKLYPDVPPPVWSLPAQVWVLAGWLVLLVLALLSLAWVQGWIALPQEKRMPFRQAWRDIRKLGQVHDAARARQAMQALSRAMDQFAGYAVTAENLPQLLRTHAVIQPHQAALQGFYHALQQTFFAGQTPSVTLSELQQLAKALSRLEVC